MRKPVTAPVRDQFEEKLVRRLENLRHFHPDRGQVVDVEEAPVVDLLRGHPPEGEPIGLLVEQRVKRVEAARVARLCR